jgi:hypothetical protein
MSKSKNNRTTKRGNHLQRVKTHDAYLVSCFPGFSNMTSPYSAPIAELLDEEIAEYNRELIPNQETIEAMKECDEMLDNKSTPRFSTAKELFEELNKEDSYSGTCDENCENCQEAFENGDCCLPGTNSSEVENTKE